MALDLGSRRIGVALSDPLRISARPLLILERESAARDVERILELAESHDVERLVIGLPRHLDGRSSPVAASFRPLVDAIRKQAPHLQVVWAEERLSTREAERILAELGVPVTGRRQKRDAVAAALILQWYLEESAVDR